MSGPLTDAIEILRQSMAKKGVFVSAIKRFLFVAPLLAGPVLHAAEFEVLDRFSVDGYTVLKGSADIPGGSFTVGMSTFVVKGGNVGIGTTWPGTLLQVNTGGVNETRQNVFATSAAGSLAYGGYIGNRAVSSNQRQGMFIEGSGSLTLGAKAYNMDFITGAGITAGDDTNVRMRIDSAGNVGIGTTAPAASLDVAGDVKIGSTTFACDMTRAGVLRWTSGHLSVCNGTDWRQLDNQPPPTVSTVSPLSGLISGGTAITINGSGFNLGLDVLIAGVAATVTGVTGSQITATTPSGSSGTKELMIMNPDGQSCVSAFTYNPYPTIATVSPASGQTSRATNITIAGTGFQTSAGVTIGGVPATINTLSTTQITATAPAIAVNGAKDVIVTNPDTGSVTKTNGFTYIAFATGGTADYDWGAYHVHTFNNSGTFTVNFAGNVEVLVVGGGGSGGGNGGGGGGAGGYQYNDSLGVTAQAYTVTVGGPSQNSSFSTITAIAGGNGASRDNGGAPTSGGSGGGGANAINTNSSARPGASGIAGQGKAGGDGPATDFGGNGGGAGGGGAGTAGNAGGVNGGNGGDGIANSITGNSVT